MLSTSLNASSSTCRSLRIISIEGNIGAGKSTLLRELQRQMADVPGVHFMQEPVDLWESIKDDAGQTILAKFYQDPAKHAFAFQIMAYTSRLEAFRRAIIDHPDCSVIVCERSLEADRSIFAKMLHDDKLIDSVSFQVYEMLFKNTSREFEIDATVYLATPPDICAARIDQRARDGESKISAEYLQKCQRYHDQWLDQMELDGTVPLLRVDGSGAVDVGPIDALIRGSA